MERVFDIIGLENGIVDLALQVDKIPGSDSVGTLKNFLWQPGGNVDNAIAAAALQGARCSFMGTVGNDIQGEFFRRDMAMHGVDTSHLITKEGCTTIAVCLAEESTRERSFLLYNGNASKKVPDLAPEDIDEAFLASARYLHVGGISGKMMKDAVEAAGKHDVVISVDGGSFTEDLVWTLDHCDVMVMSKPFYAGLFGAGDDDYVNNMKKLIKEHGMDTCVVTLGPAGCAGANRDGESFSIPAFGGYPIIDTTGAGDVYHGGFVYAHSRGWDLLTCARYASAVSFIKCTTLGGRAGIPDRKTVEQFLRDGTIDYTRILRRKEHYENVMRFE